MSLLGWTYLFVTLTFLLYLGIAVASRVKNTAGFYIAGHRVPPVANGMATAADWMSAASFISMAGMISFMGYTGSIYLLGWTGGYVLLALLLAPYLRKFGKYTVPDFVGDRYESNAARFVAVLCAIFISFTYVAGQMRGVGVVFSRFLEIDINQGVMIGMVIVLVYAVLGGMKGITWTQVAQYLVLITAYLIPAVAISWKMTGNPIPQLGFGATLSEGPNAGRLLLEVLDDLHRELGFASYTQAFASGPKNMLDVLCITLALMAGTAGLPHVLVRFYTTPDVRSARWSVFWALLFIALLYTTAPAVAAFSRVNLIQSLHGVPVGKAPNWFSNWMKTGLVKHEDKNQDGIIQYDADPRINELIIDRDIIVLANPEIANLPAWVVALVAAGGLAAALSTAAGLLLVVSSSVSHDLFKRILKPDLPEKKELLFARISAAGAVLAAGYFGIHPPGFVAQVVAFAFGLACSSFFPILLLGIFNRRATKQGAVCGMLCGMLFTASYIIYFKFIHPEASPHGWWFGISPEGIGAVGMLLNFLVTLTISALTPRPPDRVVHFVEKLREP